MNTEDLREDDTLRSRALSVGDGVSATIIWPGFFWYVFDWLSDDGWDANAAVRDFWRTAGHNITLGSQYATFKDLLEREVERRGDAAAAISENRANSNLTS